MIELPTGYYHVNFMTLLDWVDEQYADILSAEERAFSEQFRSAPLAAQRLYVRLIMRKGPHFRSDRVVYEEIGDVSQAAHHLMERDLLAVNGLGEPGELLVLLQRGELEALAKKFGRGREARKFRKDELCAWLWHELDDDEMVTWVYQQFDVYTPLHLQTLLMYRLLFFGNLSQDLTEFVLEDLGLVRYEPYPIHKHDRLFDRRELLEHTLLYTALAEQAWLAGEERDIEALQRLCSVLPDTLGEASLRRRHDRILNETGRMLERIGEMEKALTFFQRAELPPSRERRVRILEKLNQDVAATELCNAISARPLDEDEREFASRFSLKLRKKLGDPVPGAKRTVHPTRELAIPFPGKTRVEDAVVHFLAKQGFESFKTEGRVWCDLFGLCFWDIIFMPIRGAFFNRYQRGPKGLFSPRFRAEREQAVAQRLERIAAGNDITSLVADTYEAKVGTACHLVHWQYLPLDLLLRVVEAVPPAHLAAIFDRLSRNPGEFRSGFPDLFAFDGDGYRLLEVKGPGDQLQNNQNRWMKYFREHGIPYEVAKVTWQ